MKKSHKNTCCRGFVYESTNITYPKGIAIIFLWRARGDCLFKRTDKIMSWTNELTLSALLFIIVFISIPHLLTSEEGSAQKVK